MRRAFGALGAALAIVLGGCDGTATSQANTTVAATPADPEQEVFYQIFTRSMRDSNGDGEGDLRGITDSLDYLNQLGVTSILLTPLYPSEFYHNYFADDFESVDPEFGTMADYHRLVSEIHKRGMKIYLDQEIQYVAYGHPWYKSALGNPASPYSDFLIWHGPGNTKPEEGPFGITIAPRFPDGETGITTVNMKSPALKTYFEKFFLSWVDPNGDGDFSDGVDGFRLDHMMDDLDDKHILTGLFDDFWKPIFAKVRATNPKATFIAEQSDWGYGTDYLTKGDVDYVFAFPLMGAIRAFDRDKIAEAIAGTATATPAGKHQLVFAANHDTNRLASEPGITPEKLRTAAVLTMLLKGTPLIYYGEELGMRGAQRPEYQTDEKDIGTREAFEWKADPVGAPHANWYHSAKSYWTERFNRKDDGISVEEEDRDPGSLLSLYRKVLALRHGTPAFEEGSQRVLESAPGILVVERAQGDRRYLIVSNLTDAEARYRPEGVAARDLLGTSPTTDGEIVLAPYRSAVLGPR
ncbi:MAG TPA: alpha-amylase family glycosyl hydrolase [Sphingomonas sp.]|nr:alpha-amylase family glycosyl hydrolase [Sphingomonas sp.]